MNPVISRQKKWRSKPASKCYLALYMREWRRRKPLSDLKAEVVQHLGGKCVRCGYSDIRALQLDHINGDGRRFKGKLNSYTMYKAILRGEPHTAYQILCANCNWIKRAENHEAPGRARKYA